MEFIHGAVDWMLAWSASPYAIVALFLFSFWDSSFFPLPPDPLLIAMAVARPDMALTYAAVCTVASIMGAVLGYVIGNKGGRPLVERLFSRKKIEAAEGLYQRYDVWAVGAAALTPIPYKVFTITAGVARLDFGRFMAASILGRGFRFFALGVAIYFFGPSIQNAIDEYFELLTLAFLILLVAGFVAMRYAAIHLGRKQSTPEERKVVD
ncbi:MAG: DedA family protein [Rubrobacter sp.]|nr:DedA family protein [Rubrobacter sp.]